MYTVQTLLRHKGSDIWSISPDATVFEAIQQMTKKNIGALLVIDDAGKVRGILTERDYLRKVAIEGRSSRDTPVKAIMTPRVLGVSPDREVEQCMALMTEKRIRHLPVYGSDKLLGIISIGDVVKAVIRDKKIAIEQLERFILGL